MTMSITDKQHFCLECHNFMNVAKSNSYVASCLLVLWWEA